MAEMGEAAMRREWVSLKAEAERRGIASKWLKDFCKRQGVQLLGTRKTPLVKPSDIDDAFERQVRSITQDAAERAAIDATPPLRVVRR
jgi:hypothetical protein